MSASFFEMLMKGRVTRPIEEFDEETLKAIANSVVAPEISSQGNPIK
jgi:hypothetical protein